MERETKVGEKSGDGEAEKEENLGEKGFWTSLYHPARGSTHCSPDFSARKLSASLWEFRNYWESDAGDMQRSGNGNNGGRYYQRGQRNGFRDKGVDFAQFLRDPCPSSDPDQPDSASSLRRHIAQTLMQHHRAIERSNHALQPVSPASYGSSMEVAPYNPPGTPDSSHYNLKTSTELLKVLNRIWSLEEQHASNISLIKALKTELSHSRGKIKELLHHQQSNRHEMDDLMKQITEDKVGRMKQEQDRMLSAMDSLRDELEDERKLRKRSESLHRKLAKEISEAKSSLASALRDFEKEKESRKLLEDLCDEFAKAVRNYDQEVHFLKSEKDWTEKTDHDRLILHISESWLDERTQMKLDAERGSTVDKLGFEIKTFLQARQRNNGNVLPRERKKSLESIPEAAVSVSRDLCRDGDDSVGSESNCFELNKPRNGEKNPASHKVKPQMGAMANGSKQTQVVDTECENTGVGKLENGEATPGSGRGRKKETETEEVDDSRSNDVIEKLMRNHAAFSEGKSIHTDNGGPSIGTASSRRNQASPVRQWMSRFTAPEVDVSGSSTKLVPGLKENTLKSKLVEARTKAPRSRLKVFKR